MVIGGDWCWHHWDLNWISKPLPKYIPRLLCIWYWATNASASTFENMLILKWYKIVLYGIFNNAYIMILDNDSCKITQKHFQSERELTISLKEISVNFNRSMTDDVKTMTNWQESFGSTRSWYFRVQVNKSYGRSSNIRNKSM